MGRADVSATIARPIEDVFAVLTDPTQSAKWAASAIEAELITPGPPQVGSRRRAVVKGPFGRTMESVMEVTEIEPDRRVALTLISATWGGTGRTWYTFTRSRAARESTGPGSWNRPGCGSPLAVDPAWPSLPADSNMTSTT
jgi:uncharacterized protein YndB with AHSA1/START domain